jgi:hypothetical protein
MPQPGAFNTKDDFTRTRGRFWKDLEFGPGWRLYHDIADTESIPIPVPVLTTFDAETPRNWDAAKRAYRAFTKLSALAQLARVFRAMGPNTPAGASAAVVVPATHKASAPPVWTAATPEGLMEQARRNARWWSTTSLDIAIGRALQFYTGNHIPYFVARGEFGPDVTMADMHAAHEELKRKGSRELGAILSSAAGLLGAFNAVAGVVAAIVVGLYTLWTELSGGSVFPFGLPPEFHQPQPLFMRTMPVCEELARTKATVDTAISHIPVPSPPVPKIPGFVFGIAGAAAALGFVKLIWRK